MPGTATTILIDGTPTDGADPWVDSLVSGGAWTDGNGGTVTINWTAFQGTMDGQNSYGWTSAALTGLREALSLWESVANIDFVEVSNVADADAKFWWGTEAQAGEAGVLGWSDLPGYSDSEVLDILFNAQDSSMSGVLGKGGLGLVTMVHEIGHLIGLAHPHDGGAAPDASNFPGVPWWNPYEEGTDGLNQGIYTTMSYNYGWPSMLPNHTDESWGLQYGPMALDIAAIQEIYGANTTYASGNNVYKLPTSNGLGTYWSTIWDTGGIDTISNEGSSNNATIDLRAATFDSGWDIPVSYATTSSGTIIEGGYVIARGVVIENAIGGNGNDTITGNSAVNRLEGGAGNDILDGGAGADTMIGDSGYDAYYVDDYGDVITELEGGGIDTVYSSLAIYALAATLENLTLTGTGPGNGTGNSLANTITGNAGANILVGGGGADILNGLDGDDRLVVSDLSFLKADGAAGTDTLVLDGAGLSISLADATIRSKIVGIERFDIGGTGNNTLWIDQASVLTNFGETVAGKRVLVVERDQGDVVQFSEAGWTKAGSFTNTDGTFDRWVFGTAEVQIEQVATTPAPSGTILLSTLNGGTGFKLTGAAAQDYSGYSVASAGDVNGDGFDDVIVGATGASAGPTQPGASYVVFGKPSGFSSSIDLSTLNGSNGFKLSGVGAHDYSGRSVASAGDVNGDGFADLIIGSRPTPLSGLAYGATYVVFGKASGFAADINLSTLNGSTGFKLNGAAARDYSGSSVASAGDFNGDGYDDLIIGARTAASYAGETYIVYGKASGFAANLELSGLTASMGVKLRGAATGDQSGYSVASAGDVNGDGYDDVIVGAWLAGSAADYSHAGASYVVFGRASAGANINLSGLNGSNGFKLSGAQGDFSGMSVASAGDINGDGYADLIVGAPSADLHGYGSGVSYVVFGKASGFTANLNLSTLNGSNGFRLNGAASADISGSSVASAGDFNGDGFADLVIGAHYADSNGVDSGASYVVFGKASGFAASIELSSLDGGNGLALWGEAASNWNGRSVASAGDVNGDGYDDLIIGAFRADPNGTDSGASYVVFGGAFGGTVMATGTAAAEMLIGGACNDVLTGGGGGDVFHAGAGNDRLVMADLAFRLADGGTGTDTLALGGTGLWLDLSNPLVAAKLEGIERIDLTGTGNNTLVVNKLSVLGGIGAVVGGKHILVVEGNSGDKVQFVELNWTKSGSFTNADGTFDRWVFGTAEVHVEQLVASTPATGRTIVGTAGDDIISTTVTVAGQPLATGLGDVIDGGAGNDSLDGGAGNDILYGQGGDDMLIGGTAASGGTNQLWGGTGSDTASYVGTSGAVYADLAAQSGAVVGVLVDQMNSIENLIGGSGNDVLVGNADANVLTGSGGADILYGQDGDDTLIGGTTVGSTNQLWGGTGSDTASYLGTSGVVYADLGAQSAYVGGVLVDQMNSIENLTGGSGNDVLVGDEGANVVAGGAGADILYGQGGDDVLIGGAKAGSTNQLWGGTGSDTASYVGTTGVVYADLGGLAGYVDGLLVDQMNSIENLVGGSGNDVLVGDAIANVLAGGAGADVLYGQGGNDVLIGGAAASGSTNQLWGGTGTDAASYVGTTGAVYADLGALAAYVDGVLVDQMNSIENLIGSSGSDVLVGNANANVLMGGAGTDYLYGQDGSDTLIGGSAASGEANQLWGGSANDTASYVGTAGKVYADLGAQSGYVDGVLVDLMDSIENLIGGSNADTLVGNGGANQLTGGAGGDALWGKGGADVFVYNEYADSNLVTGYDIIGDFVSGMSKLDLTALGLDASHIVIQSDAQSTSLYIEKTAGVFDASTDLAISLVGANAIALSDILL